jgi:hypothetical protein
MGAIKCIVSPTALPDPEARGSFSFGDRGRVDRIPDGGRLHRYRYRALRCLRPVWRGRDAGRGDHDAVKMTFEVGPLSRALADQPDDIRAAPRPRFVPPSRAAPASGR